MIERQEELTLMVEDFCDEYLSDDYKKLSLKLIDEMASRKNAYFNRGKLELWASAIIYSISQVNSLFDESNEVHITRKDIFNYFNTTQSVVSRKAINLRDVFDMDNNFSLSEDSPDLDMEFEEEWYSNIMDHDFGESKSIFDGNTSVKGYQREIDRYKRMWGDEFFKENEGMFWLIPETRPFMQCLFEQAQMFWDMGQKEKAINQYKYLLKLNPNDNQGVRDCLFPNLVELNRLDEAYELYLKYEDEVSAFWRFTKLLLDIKNDEPFDELKRQYKYCTDYNPYIVPYLTGAKRRPTEQPLFFSFGDKNEAMYYIIVAESAWKSDGKAMKVLKKLSKT